MITLKSPEETEINLNEAPEELQKSVNERLDRDYKLLSVKRIVNYPYKNKEVESVVYKAYLIYGNLLALLTKWDFMNEVKENSMTAGDVRRMSDYWNDKFKYQL